MTTQGTTPWVLVMRREIQVKLTDKAFLIGTFASVAIIAALLGYTAWVESRAQTYDLVATADTSAMAAQIAAQAPQVDDAVEVDVVTADDALEAEALVDDEKADAWLHRDATGWVLTSRDGVDSELSLAVSTIVSDDVMGAAAERAGTSLPELRAGAAVRSELLIGDPDRAAVGEAVGFLFVLLFYLATLLFGIQLANSVVEEKQSRIVEIIAASIPVRHLLAGKVIGNTVMAVLQLVLFMTVGLLGVSFSPYSRFVPELSTSLLWFAVFFLAGFVALSCLWAVAGSLASRTEDLQHTSTPLTMLVMAIFFGGLLLEGRAAVIGSFVPPLSAVLMPKRIVAGTVDWWEPIIALGLLAALAAVTVVAGERLYRRSLLQTQGRLGLREAWSTAG